MPAAMKKPTPRSESRSMKALNKALTADEAFEAKLKHPLQQINKHKVPLKKWKNWPDICQRVFNTTYDAMMIDQRIFLHPNAPSHGSNHWKTTAWNAAWTAADACQKALKDIIAGVGYAPAV